MSIKIGSQNISGIRVGGGTVTAIYIGTTLVYPFTGAPPTSPATGFGVVLENINGTPPTSPATGFGVVLENINGGTSPTSPATGFGVVLEDIPLGATANRFLYNGDNYQVDTTTYLF